MRDRVEAYHGGPGRSQTNALVFQSRPHLPKGKNVTVFVPGIMPDVPWATQSEPWLGLWKRKREPRRKGGAAPKQNSQKVAFPVWGKALRKQKILSRHSLAGQGMPALAVAGCSIRLNGHRHGRRGIGGTASRLPGIFHGNKCASDRNGPANPPAAQCLPRRLTPPVEFRWRKLAHRSAQAPPQTPIRSTRLLINA